MRATCFTGVAVASASLDGDAIWLRVAHQLRVLQHGESDGLSLLGEARDDRLLLDGRTVRDRRHGQALRLIDEALQLARRESSHSSIVTACVCLEGAAATAPSLRLLIVTGTVAVVLLLVDGGIVGPLTLLDVQSRLA